MALKKKYSYKFKKRYKSKKNRLKALKFIILNILIKIHLNLRLNLIKNKFHYLFNNNIDISETYKKDKGYFIYVSFSIESKSFKNSSNKND